MSRQATRTFRRRATAVLLAVVVPMLLSWGCWRGAKPEGGPDAVPTPPPPTAEVSPGAAAPGPDAAGPPAEAPSAGQAAPGAQGEVEEPASAPSEEVMAGEAPKPEATDGGETGEGAPPAADSAGDATEGAAAPGGSAEGRADGARAGAAARPGHVAVARLPEAQSFDRNGPYWARGREELVYRIEFLGITMGYARFAFNGKVLLGGREVYHLSVRAWTSNVLAIIYPINDTIEYYMDIRTLAPLRQEYTSAGRKKKDNVTTYDQETGRIVYRDRESGEIRRQVDAVPDVYDPVTLAYFFRSREPDGDGKGRNVYAGRKVWEISAKPLGVEKIATDRGEFETTVIRPVIRRNGKVEDKGDMRMWMTRDERKVPVRIYAKFKKIRTWTLVGELMPERKGG